MEGRPVTPAFGDLRAFLGEVLFAGKWKHIDDPVGAGLKRVNVQTAIDKLARDVEGVHRAYEWLCNVAHPSAGATLLFCSEEAARPDHREFFIRHDRFGADGPVDDAICLASTIALTVACEAFDQGVRICDDMALRGCSDNLWR